MTFEQIKSDDIPDKVKAAQENLAIYESVKNLVRLGIGSALRIRVDHVSRKQIDHIQHKGHVYFRTRPHRLRTKTVDGYLYLWLEDKTPKRFEVVGVPSHKTLAARASAGARQA